MTQYEREELVERYLNGEMTSAEEGEFFLVAAVDEELQRTLKAYRIMDRAMMNDREVAVVENSQYRGRVMGMLAASHVTGTGDQMAEGRPPRPTGEESPAGGGFWRGFGASILGASLVAGMIVAISSVNDDPLPESSGQLPAQRQTAPVITAPPESTPVTGGSVQERTLPEVRERAPARPAERRELQGEGRNAARQSAPREATSTKSQATPARHNNVIMLPPQENGKVRIPVNVESPDTPKK